MQLSTEHGFAFICIPKCSSTAVESAIQRYCNINISGHPGIKHMSARDYFEFILPYHQKKVPLKTVETFCIMRDPLEWLMSWYRYRQRDDLKKTSHPLHKNYTGNVSFDEFVQMYLKTSQRPSFASLRTQSFHMLMDNGVFGVDRIFDLKQMDLVANYLSHKVGEQVHVPIINKSVVLDCDLSNENEKLLRSTQEREFMLYEMVRQNGCLQTSLHRDFFLSQ